MQIEVNSSDIFQRTKQSNIKYRKFTANLDGEITLNTIYLYLIGTFTKHMEVRKRDIIKNTIFYPIIRCF